MNACMHTLMLPLAVALLCIQSNPHPPKRHHNTNTQQTLQLSTTGPLEHRCAEFRSGFDRYAQRLGV